MMNIDKLHWISMARLWLQFSGEFFCENSGNNANEGSMTSLRENYTHQVGRHWITLISTEFDIELSLDKADCRQIELQS